jgi:DNA-binding GntR family transcriptional regulator
MSTVVKPAAGSGRSSLTEEAYRHLKREILENRMPPGFQALEAELASRLEMSRTPVREAVIRLQEEGLVEVIRRRGMRVLPLSAGDMREIYQVLTCVESEAAAIVAAQGPTEAELEPLRAATRDMEEALSSDDLEAWAEADHGYHVSLLNLCENKRLVHIAFTHFDQAHRVRMFTLRLRTIPEKSTREHREQVEALQSGNPRLVRDMYRAHRERAAHELIEILETYRLNNL